jgi:hypothetical protein
MSEVYLVPRGRKPIWSESEFRAQYRWFWEKDNRLSISEIDFGELLFCIDHYDNTPAVKQRSAAIIQHALARESRNFRQAEAKANVLLAGGDCSVIEYIDSPVSCPLVKEYIASSSRISVPVRRKILAGSDQNMIRTLLIGGGRPTAEELALVFANGSCDEDTRCAARDAHANKFRDHQELS